LKYRLGGAVGGRTSARLARRREHRRQPALGRRTPPTAGAAAPHRRARGTDRHRPHDSAAVTRPPRQGSLTSCAIHHGIGSSAHTAGCVEPLTAGRRMRRSLSIVASLARTWTVRCSNRACTSRTSCLDRAMFCSACLIRSRTARSGGCCRTRR